jgi:hypothetical protein
MSLRPKKPSTPFPLGSPPPLPTISEETPQASPSPEAKAAAEAARYEQMYKETYDRLWAEQKEKDAQIAAAAKTPPSIFQRCFGAFCGRRKTKAGRRRRGKQAKKSLTNKRSRRQRNTRV